MYAVLLYLIVIAGLRLVKRKRAPRARGLCAGCGFAHIQHGANAKSTTFCTFGGGVRPVRLDVLYCTDYRDRNAPPRMIPIGFVREIASVAAGEVTAAARERRSSVCVSAAIAIIVAGGEDEGYFDKPTVAGSTPALAKAR